MRTLSIGGSTLLVLAFALPASAGPLAPDTIPRDASVVAHIDLDAIRGSNTHGVVKRKLAREIREAKREIASEISPFDITLLLDASSITFWAEANGSDEGAVIIEGMDTREVVAVLEKVSGHSATRRKGLEIHSIGGEGAIAVSGSRVILAKEEASLRLTIDTIEGRAKSLQRSRSMPSLAGTRGSFLVVAIDDRAAKALQKQSHSSLLKKGSIQGAVIDIGEQRRDVVARVTVETSSNAVAKKLAEIASGGAALLSLAADEPELSRLLSTLSVTTRGTSVSAEITADPSMLLDLAKQVL